MRCGFHSCSVMDLFDKFNTNSINVTKKIVRENHIDNKLKLCAQIFAYCFYLIIIDIIDNDIVFSLPTRKRHAYLQMSSITGEKFKDMYRTGSFDNLDFIASNFTAYEIKYRWVSKCGYKEKPVYLNKPLKKRLYDLVNMGKTY